VFTKEQLDKARSARASKPRLPQDPLLRKLADGVPSTYQTLYIKSVTGHLGMRQRLRAKCLECSSWQRVEVASCPVRGCPLWKDRPYQEEDETPSQNDSHGPGTLENIKKAAHDLVG